MSIDINYAFDDYTACIAPEGWQFNENLTPEAGSKWILFLEGSPDNLRTHRGNIGRLEATEENIKKVKEGLVF